MLGHITLDRKILEWEWYQDVNVFHLFLHLLLKANHKDGTWQGKIIKRGQMIAGRDKLSQNTGLTEQEIRTCLKKLKSTNEITIKSTNKYSVITICKYDIYQSKDKKSTSKTTNNAPNEQPTSNQQLTTNKNDNNENNKEEGKPLPPKTGGAYDFVCYDAEQYLNKNERDLELIMMATNKKKSDLPYIQTELHKFHLWMLSKEKYPLGNKAVKAAFESWLIKAKQFNKGVATELNDNGDKLISSFI
jgi:hypothetical protein